MGTHNKLGADNFLMNNIEGQMLGVHKDSVTLLMRKLRMINCRRKMSCLRSLAVLALSGTQVILNVKTHFP